MLNLWLSILSLFVRTDEGLKVSYESAFYVQLYLTVILVILLMKELMTFLLT